VLRLINGTGLLIDPELITLSLYESSYTAKGSMGAADFGKSPRNKAATFLGMHPQHKVFSDVVVRHGGNSAVRLCHCAEGAPYVVCR
jgi:hypothetical protein